MKGRKSSQGRWVKRWKGLLHLSLGAWMSLSLSAVEISTTESESPEGSQSVIVLSGGEVVVEEGSNEAQLRQDFGLRPGGTGGLEAFSWVGDGTSDWQVFVDARLVENPDEAKFDLKMVKPEEAEFGIRLQYWTEYAAGTGPWYPVSGSRYLLTPAELERELSRLTIRYERSLTDALRMHLAYGLFDRRGAALSTRYGDDFQYRIGGTPSRGFVPGALQTAETLQTLDARFVWQDWVRLTGLRLHGQRRESSRTRLVERGADDPVARRWTRQSERSVDDLFSFSTFARREWGDTLVGSVGWGFTRLDGTISGSRIFGSSPEAQYDPEFAALQFGDRGFLDLDSTRQLRQSLFNLNLVCAPTESIRWSAGARVEKLETQVFGSYMDTYSTVDWTAAEFQREEADMLSRAERSLLDVSGYFEVRYTGFKKLLLFSRIEGSRQEGDLDEDWVREETYPDEREAMNLLERATDFDRRSVFWEVGGNTYPLKNLHVSLKAYLKVKDNGYSLAGVDVPVADYTLYPGHLVRQRFEIRDVNGRVSWRVTPNLKLLSRIDYQESTVENSGGGLMSIQSAERRRVVYNQSVTWSPGKRIFLTAHYSQVDDLTETLASDLEGTFAGIVSELPNDYRQVDATAFVVLTKRIDAHLGYQYLEMDNYRDASPSTLPYGADLSLEMVSVGLILHVGDATRLRMNYRYFERQEPSANNLNDYTAHLVSGLFQVNF